MLMADSAEDVATVLPKCAFGYLQQLTVKEANTTRIELNIMRRFPIIVLDPVTAFKQMLWRQPLRYGY